jgi:hypothetical protein
MALLMQGFCFFCGYAFLYRSPYAYKTNDNAVLLDGI